MSERTCLMVDIPQSDWDKISKLSGKYKISAIKQNNAAGFIRAMLYLLIRDKRIKCLYDEDIPDALKKKVSDYGVKNIAISDIARKCDEHRQIRVSDEFKIAVLQLSESLKIPYGGIVRSLVAFSTENL